MVKLNMSNGLKYGTTASDEEISNFLSIIKEEQDSTFFVELCLGAIVNPNMFCGFLTAYMMIRDALVKQECEDLERLVK